jgi:hypothetical protein
LAITIVTGILVDDAIVGRIRAGELYGAASPANISSSSAWLWPSPCFSRC